MLQETFTWFAAVDWGSEKHQGCVLDARGGIAGEREFSHNGAGLAELCDWILSIAGERTSSPSRSRSRTGPLSMRCWIGVSSSTPSIPSSSTACATASVLPVPRTTGETPTFLPPGCGPIDTCSVACNSLIHVSSSCASGRALPRAAEGTGAARQSLAPPALAVLSADARARRGSAANWFLDLWTLAPTPAKAKHLRQTTIEQLLKRHRIRRIDAETVLRTLRQPAIKVADGVAEAASVHIRSLIARLRIVNRELRGAARRLDELCAALSERSSTVEQSGERRDVEILKSMPVIGRINLATLLAEASGPLGRRDYQALRTLSGVAPVTRRSGKSHIVVRRYAAHVRLRDAVYHWARVAIQHDPKSRTRYGALRQRGHSHGRAIRGVADRLLALACILLQRQTLFDPDLGKTVAA
jgi:hypothetical protein